jgi:hypothetical protein
MKRIGLLLLPALLAVSMVLPATAAAARPATGGLLTDMPVTSASGFTGFVTITEITRNAAGDLLFSGTVENAAGAVVDTFTGIAGTLSQGGTQAVCDILFLDLGPIFLDVLGLTVDLSPITLDINAVPGPGNLLGNLLCAVAGLLDGGLLGGGLAGLLDRLLGIINNLLG